MPLKRSRKKAALKKEIAAPAEPPVPVGPPPRFSLSGAPPPEVKDISVHPSRYFHLSGEMTTSLGHLHKQPHGTEYSSRVSLTELVGVTREFKESKKGAQPSRSSLVLQTKELVTLLKEAGHGHHSGDHGGHGHGHGH
jgi:hypothetical protein